MSPRVRSVLALGLPLRRVSVAWATAACVLAVYLATMARDLTFYDSPELALVAHQLGLGHPIGEPLHTWLGFAVSHLGIDPVIALTAMSALFGVLAIVPAFALAERLAGDDAHPLAIAAPLAAAALHPIAWDPSTRVEVYSLAAFLALWALARSSADEKRAWPAGLALGLAASTNAVIAAAHAVAIAPRVLRAPRRARELALFTLAGIAGLAPYSLIALVGADRARFVWGAPEDAASLAAYLGGADYARNAGIGASDFLAHLTALASWAAREATLPIALVGLAAFVWRARAITGLRWALPIAASLSVAFVARNLVFSTDVPDYRGYLFAPWLASAAGVAALACALAARGARFRAYGAIVALLPSVAIAIAPAHLASPRDTPSLARAMIRGALRDAPRGAIVIAESDHWVAPLLYAQEAEGARPDVVLVAHGLASSSWYWEHLYARHPELAPFALRGPGGRDARIRRFLDANADRPVLAESWSVAERAGRTPCAVSWLVFTDRCDRAPPASAASQALDRVRPERGEALEVAGAIGLARGEALFRLGRGADAYAALLAGIDTALPSPPPRPALPERGPPLRGALAIGSRPAAIHDPARNVVLAALVLDALGHRADALALANVAASMGLSDAARALGP